jgi:hypothetical protein
MNLNFKKKHEDFQWKVKIFEKNIQDLQNDNEIKNNIIDKQNEYQLELKKQIKEYVKYLKKYRVF